MARSEARILVDIWDDPDFLALSPTAQRKYMFLLSQRDLAHDGVLALRERRWSKSAAGMTTADVTRDLDELTEAWFVVVDEDTEELLIRSFIRRDKVFKQPNVLRAARDHLALVRSQRIRDAIGVELQRIADEEEMSDSAAAVLAAMLADVGKGSPKGSRKGSANPSRRGPGDVNPSGKGSPKGSAIESDTSDVAGNAGSDADNTAGGNPSGKGSPKGSPKGSQLRPGERGVVTAVSRDSPNPAPLSPNPEAPVPPSADAAASTVHAGAIVAAYCDGATNAGLERPSGKLCSRIGRDAKRLLDEGKNPTRLIAAATEMGQSGFNDLDVAYRRAEASERPTRRDTAQAAAQPTRRRDRHTNYAAMVADLQGGQP